MTDASAAADQKDMDGLRSRILGLMEECGVTADQVAEAAGVPELVQSLNGDRLFSSYELACIGEQFNVTVMWLLTGAERRFTSIISCNLDEFDEGPEGPDDSRVVIVRDYRDDRGLGYIIESGEQGFRWSWDEEGVNDRGPWRTSLAAALRDAADDWDESGDGGNRSRVLRSVATREERRSA